MISSAKLNCFSNDIDSSHILTVLPWLYRWMLDMVAFTHRCTSRGSLTMLSVLNLLREKAPIIGEPLLHEVVPLIAFAGRAKNLLELAERAEPELRVFGPALRRL